MMLKLKIIAIAIPILLCSGSVFAQFPPIQWQHCYGGSDFDDATVAIPLGDTGFAIAGTASSYDGDRVSPFCGGADFWLVNIDNYGAIKWERSYGGNFSDNDFAMTKTSFGYLLAGVTNSTYGEVTGLHGDQTNPQNDCWVVATDTAGNLLWERCYGGSKLEMCYSMVNTDDGNHIFAGLTSSNDGDVAGYTGLGGAWVVKFNDTGKIIWQKVYDSSTAFSIKQTSGHGYVVTGYSVASNLGPDRKGDLWVVKLNDTGGITWRKFFGGTGYDWGKTVVQTTDGGYVIAGYTNSVDGDITGNHGGNDLWVLKLNSAGVKQWSKVYGGSGDDEATSIIQTFDGGYLVSGYSNSIDGDITGNLGLYDIWILKLDAAGSLQWQKSYGGSLDDYSAATSQTPDSGFIVAGDSHSNNDEVSGNHGASDYWIVRLDKYGEAVPDPKKDEAVKVYPTAGHGTVYIDMPPGYEAATIQLFNMDGQELPGASSNGLHQTIQLQNSTFGNYLIQVTHNGNVQTFKVVVY